MHLPTKKIIWLAAGLLVLTAGLLQAKNKEEKR